MLVIAKPQKRKEIFNQPWQICSKHRIAYAVTTSYFWGVLFYSKVAYPGQFLKCLLLLFAQNFFRFQVFFNRQYNKVRERWSSLSPNTTSSCFWTLRPLYVVIHFRRLPLMVNRSANSYQTDARWYLSRDGSRAAATSKMELLW